MNDVSFYVVALNQLIAELNRLTRDVHGADKEEIKRVCQAIIVTAQLLKERVKHD